MNAFDALWKKLAASKEYREEFVAAQVKRGIPFQIRALMKNIPLTQDQLAERSGLTQGVISRAANPDYGNLTLNTIIRVAAGFDVAFIGKFVPFSEFDRWFTDLDEDKIRVPTFDEENEAFSKPHLAKAAAPGTGSALSAPWSWQKQSEDLDFASARTIAIDDEIAATETKAVAGPVDSSEQRRPVASATLTPVWNSRDQQSRRGATR